MQPPLVSGPALDEFSFSPVQGGPLSRFRKAVGLVPEGSLGLLRRTAAIVALAWLPLVVGAFFAREALKGQSADPLLGHFGVNARFLISVPLLIFAEVYMERIIPPMISHFVSSGLVGARTLPQFRAALESAKRFRDSVWGSVFVLAALASVFLLAGTSFALGEDVSWAVSTIGGRAELGFAGWWYLLVSRPIFVGLLAVWFWRLVVLWRLVWTVSKLELHLVASHPDAAGGLGFLEGTAVASVPLVLALSVVISGRWGHEVLHHGVHVDALKPMAVVAVALSVVCFNGPLLLIGRGLREFKRSSLLEYGDLASRQNELVYQKWIRNKEVGDQEILNAPELGPVADVAAIYEAVAKMRFAPIGKQSLIPVIAATILPMIPVFAIEIPIKQVLLKLGESIL
jgi:hypothetical protein